MKSCSVQMIDLDLFFLYLKGRCHGNQIILPWWRRTNTTCRSPGGSTEHLVQCWWRQIMRSVLSAKLYTEKTTWLIRQALFDAANSISLAMLIRSSTVVIKWENLVSTSFRQFKMGIFVSCRHTVASHFHSSFIEIRPSQPHFHR